eukprot:CAMPEP_0177256104 /NCGR_PEP_ID=MMETSP0367-20130122/56747_1 /TAXON_ID=447022 ORGANISM="Scrippsiella hangoei-like, Strain SHHI-4" /NCGR_SAMPLE_ID=MMETSP0367 /ASSEMBLY_ACC=CAM_ASM_000362 /LENGTH=57 /DNA_ID=CAMNT_0018709933 /DNA_START=34 /DNA_END=203 /DNA_ORIENTATION=-
MPRSLASVYTAEAVADEPKRMPIAPSKPLHLSSTPNLQSGGIFSKICLPPPSGRGVA